MADDGSGLDRTLEAIAADLRAGKLTAQELVAAAADNWQAREPALMAYKTWDGDGAAADAATADSAFARGRDLGPLQGIPISIKDIYGVAGLPVFAGSPARLPAAWEREGPLVQALRRQLAPVTGKTHTVEFALGILGTNVHWGTPRNPWDGARHRAPGGSSAGAGVSLWQGTALVAFGTDTAGSVRAPASFTGVVGLKTTFGRWSTDGIVPLSPLLDTPGPLTRSAADLAWVFAALDPATAPEAAAFRARAREAEVAGLRIGVAEPMFEGLDPGIAEAVEAALAALAKAGARVSRLGLPMLEDVFAFHAGRGLTPPALAAFLDGELPDWAATLDPAVKGPVDGARSLSAIDFLRRLAQMHALRRAAAPAFEGVDVIAAPTMAITPPALDDVADPDRHMAISRRGLRNTSVANVLEWCAVTLPAGLDSAGMPAGLMLMAPGGADAELTCRAAAVERVLGTPLDRLGRPPGLSR